MLDTNKSNHFIYRGNIPRSSGYEENFYRQRDSRIATVNFTWRFGTGQSQAPRRTTGAEEEKCRAG